MSKTVVFGLNYRSGAGRIIMEDSAAEGWTVVDIAPAA